MDILFSRSFSHRVEFYNFVIYVYAQDFKFSKEHLRLFPMEVTPNGRKSCTLFWSPNQQDLSSKYSFCIQVDGTIKR